MPFMPTINVTQPIVAAYAVPETQLWISEEGQTDPVVTEPPSILTPSAENQVRESPPQSEELTQLLATLNGITDRLRKLHEHMRTSHPAEIAKLAIEIARKILMYKVSQGDYEIQAIVAEALKEAPTTPNIVVHLNPEDLTPCQELQRQAPQSPFAGLELTADRSVGRGECLVETPKGIVKSFMEEHLERISEALQKVQ